MTLQNHEAIVSGQFGPRADAYLTSAVHAAGEDLDRMVQLLGPRPGARALDLGCGGGHAAFRLAPLVEQVVACDLSEAMLAVVAREAERRNLANLSTQLGAAETLPCPPASFDLVVSRYSAHHWRDLPAGLAQVRRVLKPDGTAVFMDVVAPESPLLDTWLQSLELLRDPSHVRNRSLAQWRTLLTAAGFIPGEPATFRPRVANRTWVRFRPSQPHGSRPRLLSRSRSGS
jgi:SAM-dependent methyltransferase